MYATATKHAMKEEVEQLVEREESPTKGTRKVASYGNHEHTAEVRYNPEYQEYQVHHYKAGKHQGEGPVSYHYDDKADAHSTAKHSVGIKEEVTNDGFKAELEDNKAKAAGTKKQPDVHKAAVQSVKQESFSEKLSMLKKGVRSFLKGKNND
jgi:hypothetical protein